MPALLQQNASLEMDLVRETATSNCTIDEGLQSVVALLLFLDKRVPDGVPWDGDRSGYWAAALLGFEPGSLLWTLRGKPNTPENLKLAEEHAVDALQPLVRADMAKEIRATASYVPDAWCRLVIEIRSGRSWLTAWENTVNEF